MRLVNADFVISVAEKEFSEEDASKVRWLLAHIPTAYDAEKVERHTSDYFDKVVGQVTDGVRDHDFRKCFVDILVSMKSVVKAHILSGGR